MKIAPIISALAAISISIVSCKPETATPKLEEAAFSIEPGSRAELSNCYVRKNSVLSAAVSSEDAVTGVTLGRGGNTTYWGAWVCVTVDSLLVYEQDYFDDADQTVLFDRFAHGLDISGGLELSVITDAPDSTGIVRMSAGGSIFEHKIHWRGGGRPYLVNDGSADIEAHLSFLRGDACQPVWFIADSYFMEYDVERWPYYMVQEGRLDWMADHLPGGGSAEFLDCFRSDLQYGKPQYAVWMMGMNDFDDLPDAPNPDWMEATAGFIAACEENGVTPVLVTVPTVPERFHDRKSEWVRNSGYMYVDWYAAVGAKPWDGSQEDLDAVAATGRHRGWDADYLYQDEVHPSESGAAALWMQVKKDLYGAIK